MENETRRAIRALVINQRKGLVQKLFESMVEDINDSLKKCLNEEIDAVSLVIEIECWADLMMALATDSQITRELKKSEKSLQETLCS